MAEAHLKIDIMPQIAAVAEPGDTVLIGFDRTLSDEELDRLREDFGGFTETTGVHVAFVEHATSMAVAKGPVPASAHKVELMDGSTVTLEGYEEPGER